MRSYGLSYELLVDATLNIVAQFATVAVECSKVSAALANLLGSSDRAPFFHIDKLDDVRFD
jgi:hypothetical protein